LNKRFLAQRWDENIKCKAYFAEFGQSEYIYFTINETSNKHVFIEKMFPMLYKYESIYIAYTLHTPHVHRRSQGGRGPWISVPSKVRNCAVPPENLRSAISFSCTSNILNLIRYVHTSHSPFNVGNASLVVSLHGCAVACASYATKQTFAQ